MIETGNEFGETVISFTTYHSMALTNYANFKGHSITESPINTLKYSHTIIWDFLVKAKVDWFAHMLKDSF